MQDFGVRDAAQILGLSERQVRRYVQDGFLVPKRGKRGAHRFDFQDLVLLRTAKGLLEARVPPRKIRRALTALKARLPAGEPLSGVRVALEGGELVVRDPTGAWIPESGQAVFDFSVDELRAQIAPLEGRLYDDDPLLLEPDDAPLALASVSALPLKPPEPMLLGGEESVGPDDGLMDLGVSEWLDLAEALVADRRPGQARDALRRALELDPYDTEARRHLGRLLEQDGNIEAAEGHFRLARTIAPGDPDLALDHGRVLAQLERLEEALEAFQAVIALDPDCEEAYVGAAHLHERCGDPKAARRVRDEYQRRRRPPDA